jgi:hypothetical protein
VEGGVAIGAKGGVTNGDIGKGAGAIGALIGTKVGVFVGALVGDFVGAFVGRLVGAFVGRLVGGFVGRRVGNLVGGRTGALVEPGQPIKTSHRVPELGAKIVTSIIWLFPEKLTSNDCDPEMRPPVSNMRVPSYVM